MMKILKIAAPTLAVVVVVIAWLAPIGQLPGFFMGGTATG